MGIPVFILSSILMWLTAAVLIFGFSTGILQSVLGGLLVGLVCFFALLIFRKPASLQINANLRELEQPDVNIESLAAKKD